MGEGGFDRLREGLESLGREFGTQGVREGLRGRGGVSGFLGWARRLGLTGLLRGGVLQGLIRLIRRFLGCVLALLLFSCVGPGGGEVSVSAVDTTSCDGTCAWRGVCADCPPVGQDWRGGNLLDSVRCARVTREEPVGVGGGWQALRVRADWYDRRGYLERSELERLDAGGGGPRAVRTDFARDSAGYLIGETLWADGKLVRRREYTYNARRDLESVRTLGGDGEVLDLSEYRYGYDVGAEGEGVARTLWMSRNGTRYDYKYDALGHQIGHTCSMRDGADVQEHVEREFDALGRLVEERRLDSLGTPLGYSRWEYDSQGHVVGHCRGEGAVGLGARSETRYDDKGNATRRTEYAADGSVRVLETTYRYDAHGNWVRAEQRLRLSAGDSSRALWRETRELSYY